MAWRCLQIFLLVCALSPLASGEESETFGCEANPTGDPIGGGPGYRDIKTTGDFIVKSRDELLSAFKEAKAGQVIFLPDGVEIDLSGERNIKIPAGVTLAGTRGLNDSLGARIFDQKRWTHTLFVTGGRNVRITGLRIEGPYAEADRVGDQSEGISIRYSDTEVDNCEISKFNCVGIGVNSNAINVYIHHNYIHHCQLGGLGYGVATSASDVRIIANKFDYCRHHIASSGSPGAGYEAAWNLVLPNATGHHFDMHGGRDRGDSTDIAGDWLHIHHNTFQGKHRHVVIRGVPCQGAEVHHNWFSGPVKDKVISGGNTRVYQNVWGPQKILEK